MNVNGFNIKVGGLNTPTDLDDSPYDIMEVYGEKHGWNEGYKVLIFSNFIVSCNEKQVVPTPEHLQQFLDGVCKDDNRRGAFVKASLTTS